MAKNKNQRKQAQQVQKGPNAAKATLQVSETGAFAPSAKPVHANPGQSRKKQAFGPTDEQKKKAEAYFEGVRKEGRNMTLSAKDKKALKDSEKAALERLETNTYAIKPLHENWQMFFNGYRPNTPPAPATLPESLVARLDHMFIGDKRPFYKRHARTTACAQDPVGKYMQNLMVATALQKAMEKLHKAAAPAVHVLCPPQILNSVAGTLQRIAQSAEIAQITFHHYSEQAPRIAPAAEHVLYRHHVLDMAEGHLRVNGARWGAGEFPPLIVSLFSCSIASLELDFVRLAYSSTIIEVGYERATGAEISVGRPYPVFRATGFSSATRVHGALYTGVLVGDDMFVSIAARRGPPANATSATVDGYVLGGETGTCLLSIRTTPPTMEWEEGALVEWKAEHALEVQREPHAPGLIKTPAAAAKEKREGRSSDSEASTRGPAAKEAEKEEEESSEEEQGSWVGSKPQEAQKGVLVDLAKSMLEKFFEEEEEPSRPARALADPDEEDDEADDWEVRAARATVVGGASPAAASEATSEEDEGEAEARPRTWAAAVASGSGTTQPIGGGSLGGGERDSLPKDEKVGDHAEERPSDGDRDSETPPSRSVVKAGDLGEGGRPRARRNRGGRLDPIARVNAQSSRRDHVAAPPAVVEAPGGGWAFTRAFVSWLQTQEALVTLGVVSGVGAVGWLWWNRGSILTTSMLGGAIGGALGYGLTPSDPYVESVEGEARICYHLGFEDQAALSNVVASRFASLRSKGLILAPQEAVSIAAQVARALSEEAGKPTALQLMPNVYQEWRALAACVAPTERARTWALRGAALGALLTLQYHVRLPRMLTGGNLAAVVKEIMQQPVPENFHHIEMFITPPYKASVELERIVVPALAPLGATIDSQIGRILTPGYVARLAFAQLVTAVAPEELIYKPLIGYLLGVDRQEAANKFALFEFLSYAWMLYQNGVPLEVICILRWPALMMHVSTGAVPWWAGILIHLGFNTWLTTTQLSWVTNALQRRGYSVLPALTQLEWDKAPTQLVADVGMIPALVGLVGAALWWVGKRLGVSGVVGAGAGIISKLFPTRADGLAPVPFRRCARPIGYAHPTVCVRQLRIKQLRPDAKMRVREAVLAQECRAGQGYHIAGPYLICIQVYCFRGCVHNILAAATSRMAGIPKCFSCPFEYEVQSPKVDRKIEESFGAVQQEIVSNFRKPLVVMLDQAEWVKRFPAGKAAALMKSWLEIRSFCMEYKSFIKKEKSLLTEAEEDALIDTDGTADPTVLVKLDPRGISVPSEEVRVQTGPWCNMLNRGLHAGFAGAIRYVPGDTPDELSAWFTEACVRVSAGAQEYALAVQGDDSLLIWRRNGETRFFASDFSRYDMSQRVAHFSATWKLISHLGLPPPDPKTINIIMNQQGLIGDGKRYCFPFGSMTVAGTMASGDGVTISFNSLILVQAVVSYIRSGLTSFDEFCASIGFSATYQEGPIYRNRLAVDFLQSRPWLTSDGGRIFAPKPGRILARFFWIPRSYNKQHKYMKEAAQLAYGLLQCANHVPIINDICRRVLELQPATSSSWAEEGPEELRSWRKGGKHDEHPDTEEEMSEFYGIGRSDLVYIRERCKEWHFGEPIDNTPHLERVANIIVRADTA